MCLPIVDASANYSCYSTFKKCINYRCVHAGMSIQTLSKRGDRFMAAKTNILKNQLCQLNCIYVYVKLYKCCFLTGGQCRPT